MNLVLVLTDRCNRSCAYCYADRRDDGGEMTLEVARRSIELARRRSETPLRIGFFGGEPLMSFPRLREIVDHARRVCERPPSFTLTTNGDALTDEVAEYFGGIDIEVTLSAHDEDLFELRRAARRLLAVGVQPRGVLVATPENCGTLVGRVEALLRAGIETVAISPQYYSPWSDAAREQLEAAYRGLAALFVERRRAGHPFRLNQLDPRLQALRSGIPLRETACELGQELLTVGPDGWLFPCDRMAVDELCAGTRIGHVEVGVDEIGLQRIVHERDRIPETCGACEHSVTCLGACACVNVHLSGDAGAIPEVVCWHERLAGSIARELLPAAAIERPAQRIRRRFIRLTAGLLTAASITAACGEEAVDSGEPAAEPPRPMTLEGQFEDGFYEAELTDADGETGRASLHVKLRLTQPERVQLLQAHEPEIEACLVRLFSTRRISRLTLPEQEQALNTALVGALREILGEDTPIEGVDLRIWTATEHAELMKRLESMGYIGIGD